MASYVTFYLVADNPRRCVNVLPSEDCFYPQIPPCDDDYSDPNYPFEAYILKVLEFVSKALSNKREQVSKYEFLCSY